MTTSTPASTSPTPSGTPIYAANDGTVIGGCGGGYGNCVLIDHGDGMVTLYAHQTIDLRRIRASR